MTRSKQPKKRVKLAPFTPEEAKAIRRYLAYASKWAANGYESCMAGAKSDSTGSQAQNALYWKNVKSGLAMFANRLKDHIKQ